MIAKVHDSISFIIRLNGVLLEGDVMQGRDVGAFGVLEKEPVVVVVQRTSLLGGKHFEVR